jgi:hypothetical protein
MDGYAVHAYVSVRCANINTNDGACFLVIFIRCASCMSANRAENKGEVGEDAPYALACGPLVEITSRHCSVVVFIFRGVKVVQDQPLVLCLWQLAKTVGTLYTKTLESNRRVDA